MVRNEAVYVRRRRVALLVVVAFLALSVLGVTRLVGFLSGGAAEAALRRRPPPRRRLAAKPTIPVPKPSPVEAQGDPGPSDKTAMVRILRLTGDLTPKSVVASKQGLVFAQNMMYTHTVTAYRADGALAGDHRRLASTSRSSASRATRASSQGVARGGGLHPRRPLRLGLELLDVRQGLRPRGARLLHARVDGTSTQHRLPDRHQDLRHRPGRRGRVRCPSTSP